TITFIAGGNRAVESDTRISSTDVAGFSTARRPGRRTLDVQSVMVHESGHTLGFAHVSARDVVMNAFVRRGGVSGRLLGRGDAIASNAKY
ncbi:MAG: matrixin family metalloprotease, partial [Thermoleophilia bacterium]